MKIFLTGCSWIQRMHRLTGGDMRTGEVDDVVIDYESFGGQGLWKIEHHLKLDDFSQYDFVVIQLPTPIRNEVHCINTTLRFKDFIKNFF